MKLQEEIIVALKKRLGTGPVFKLREDGRGMDIAPLGTDLVGSLALPDLEAGKDYMIALSPEGDFVVGIYEDVIPQVTMLGGFHVHLGGEVVPESIWDLSFLPAAADPRGMFFGVVDDQPGWYDIYIMNRDWKSRADSEIADGYKYLPHGSKNLNWKTAKEGLAKEGKQLLSRREYEVLTEGALVGAACGVKPIKTARHKDLTSNRGMEQCWGALWMLTRDSDKDGWPYIFGGYWLDAGGTGPRRVSYCDPGNSHGSVGARGRCDHMKPVQG